jgi:hypothetical protein
MILMYRESVCLEGEGIRLSRFDFRLRNMVYVCF